MKTILFLINGFGIEKKESYSVYDATLMPYFDRMMKGFMFGSLESDVKNIYDGYRNMSLEINGLYNYNIYKREAENGNLSNNETILSIKKDLEERKSKLHLFCFVDTSMQIVDNLKDFLKQVNKERDKKIYLHIVLTSNNYEDYPQILEVLSKINIDLNGEARIGMVLGLSNILNTSPVTELNFFLRNMISELGEKWQSFKQKLDVSYGTKSAPSLVNPFVVNTGFSVGNDDMFLIWNYDNVDISNYMNGVKSINYGDKENIIKFYSLFPITYREKISNVLNFEVANNSLATNMKGLGFKTLVMTKKDTINNINYYLNGMEMVNNPDITYIGIEDVLYNKDVIVNIINTYPQDFVIINYDITDAENIEDLQEKLKNIDIVLGGIFDNADKLSCNIIVSSIYGMNKTLNNNSGEICNIMYSKVPVIFASNVFTRKNYLLNDGKISELFKVCYKGINKTYPGISILTKKNILYRMFFK